jgi:hypothetical protein
MTKRPDSLAKLLTHRVGVFKAARVLSFLVMYGSVCLDRGERVSMEDFSKTWGYSPATAYRDLKLFRAAIPEFAHPHDLLMAVMEHRAGQFSAVAGLWGVA